MIQQKNNHTKNPNHANTNDYAENQIGKWNMIRFKNIKKSFAFRAEL